nr:9480_t:CDS:2 [Entrophospora candida]
MATLFRGILHKKVLGNFLKTNNYKQINNLIVNNLSHRNTAFTQRSGFHNLTKTNNATVVTNQTPSQSTLDTPPSLEPKIYPQKNNIDNNLNKKGTNPPLSFPCIDQNQFRTLSLDGGPEPNYEKIITGYKTFHYDKSFICDYGGILPELDIAYETWGELNEKKSNAIIIQTGLSGSSHAKSHEKNTHPGWWENFIGPGLSIDTNKFFVICTNVIGGCYGSTGPSSIDPSDGNRYATRFPILTIFDMVRAQFLLLDYLGIDKLYASVGSSMGGMQSMASVWLYPERVSRLISISACARSHPYSIALRHTQRQVLMSDPNWNKGFYYNSIPPHVGMKLAREIATISYRSGPEWEQRFGRKRSKEDQTPALCPDFLIETYLDHQGERFCLQYDPNSLLYISKAMDLFDMSASTLDILSRQREKTIKEISNRGDISSPINHNNNSVCNVSSDGDGNSNTSQQSALKQYPTSPSSSESKRKHISSLATSKGNFEIEDLVQGLSKIKVPSLILGVQSDILFPYWQQKEIAECLRIGGNDNVTYYELDSMYGHDTFLIDLTNVGGAIKGHLEFGS